MANKREVIKLVIDKLNGSISLLEIVNENGTGPVINVTELTLKEAKQYYRIVDPGTTDFTEIGSRNNEIGTVFKYDGDGTSGTGTCEQVNPIYEDVPFIPVIFKLNDNGELKVQFDFNGSIITDFVPPKQFIPVGFVDPELSQENIFNPDGSLNPIQAWSGGVGVAMMISAEDVEQYARVYDLITIGHAQSFINIEETINIFGANRVIDMDSGNIVDVPEIQLINRIDFKQITFGLGINITNTGFLRGSRRRLEYLYDTVDDVDLWEDTNANNVTFNYLKTLLDDTNSGDLLTSVITETVTRSLTFNIMNDIGSIFVNDIIDAIDDDEDIDQEFTLRLVRNYPGLPSKYKRYNMTMGSCTERPDVNFTLLDLTFKEL